ncbi:MAG: hypothetical protein H6742_08425 [Alphaproteobacteria bacterium]|nr:hypothetical protein [Alphaproteobacteria bacterium]
MVAVPLLLAALCSPAVAVDAAPAPFQPAFPLTALHESGVYRTAADPSAVGAVSTPAPGDDLGGKTYGVYQFESFVFVGGSADTDAARASTLSRFVSWPDNPYGSPLRATRSARGLASPAFDVVWVQLASEDNQGFGRAQEDFLRVDKGPAVDAFVARARLSDEVAADDAFFDLALGTLNHVGGLVDGAADALAARAEAEGRALTTREAARALCDYKLDHVERWFRSSPGAWEGIRRRFEAERAAFAEPPAPAVP